MFSETPRVSSLVVFQHPVALDSDIYFSFHHRPICNIREVYIYTLHTRKATAQKAQQFPKPNLIHLMMAVKIRICKTIILQVVSDFKGGTGCRGEYFDRKGSSYMRLEKTA
jgi:hypothetical protein